MSTLAFELALFRIEEPRALGGEGIAIKNAFMRETGIGVCCSGLFALTAFFVIASFDDGLRMGVPFHALSLVRAVTYLALAVFSHKFVSLLTRKRLLFACAVAMTVCAAAAKGILVVCGSEGSVMSGVLQMAFCVPFCILYLAWIEFYAQLDMRHNLASLCAVHFFSALLSYSVFLSASPFVIGAVFLVLPFVSLVMLFKADALTAKAAYRKGETQKLGWEISFRPIVLLAVFAMTNQFLRSFLGLEGRAFVLVGVCAAALGVALLICLWFDKFELKMLYRVSVPVLVAGAMFALVDVSGGGVAAALCSNAAFTLFFIFITAVFSAISFRYGVNAVWLFGIVQSCLMFGSFVGASIGDAGLFSLIGINAPMTLLGFLVVCLVAFSMLLVSDRDFETTWGISSRDDDGFVTPFEEGEAMQRRCAKAARCFGLTRREEEVLLLMMQGQTLSHIGEELFIADSTIKTHTRHIYRKMGVANRQELSDFVKGRPF